jgi:O-antigen ligase
MNNFQRLLLGVIVLEIPIQVDTYLSYQEKWAEFGAIGGFNLSITSVCLGILYAAWLVEHAAASGFPWRERLYVDWPLTTYLGVAVASCFFAENRQLALSSIALLAQAYLLHAYVANRVKSRADATFVVTMLLVALAMQGAIMLALGAVGRDVDLGPIAATVSPDFRVEGTIGSSNSAASYLALLMAPALGVLATSLHRPVKLLAIAALCLSGVALLLTLSRGGWLAAGLSVTLYCAFAVYQRRASAWLPVTVAFAALAIGGFFHQSIADRIFSDDGGSALSRLPLNQAAWQMIGDYPALGVGANNSTVVGSRYALLPEFRGEWFYATHNKYLLEWEELGLLGLAAFVWFLWSTIRTGWKTWQRQDVLVAPIALGLTVAVAGQTLHMTVDIFNNRPQVQMLWLCAGLIVALSRLEGATDHA